MEEARGVQLSQLLHGADSGTGKVAGPGAAGRGRALPLDQQVRVAAQLADAMEYVHAQRVMHGDLKPQARCQTRTRPAACAPCTRRLSGSEGGGDWDRGASAQRRPSVLGRVVTGCLCAQNLVYCEGQRHVVKLIDFGLACFFPPGVDELMRPTKARARTPPAPCTRDSLHLFQFLDGGHGRNDRPSPSLSTGRLRLSWR